MSIIEDDYVLLADLQGDMLILRVAHKLTGIVIYTKRKRVINRFHIKSEIHAFRDYMLERNGLKQVVLDYLTESHDIDKNGKDLRTILDEVKEAQVKKGYFDVSSNDIEEIEREVEKGRYLNEVIKEKFKN